MSHICIILARFYADIADELLRGATAAIQAGNNTYEVIEVPGAFEIPSTMSMAIESGKFDGYVALGCVIRGETTHYDYVCMEAARGINQLAMDHFAPLGFGVLTVENTEQAWARARITQGNKGGDAASVCLHMIAVKKAMKAL